MSIIENIFDKVKFFPVLDNADQINANGKQWFAVPQKVKLKNNKLEYVFDDRQEKGKNSFTESGDGQVDGTYYVLGAMQQNHTIYYEVGYLPNTKEPGFPNVFVRSTDQSVTPIWGVKALLSAFCGGWRYLLEGWR